MTEQHQERPLNKTNSQLNEPTSPGVGKDLRLKYQVQAALSGIAGGKQLDEYFGITSGSPKQPGSEARQTEELIADLQNISASSAGFPELLKEISGHANNSGADQDALRSLMYRKKSKES